MSIYIVTHKIFDIPKENGYIPIQVGAIRGHVLPKGAYFDDDGDNISDKNKNYCELTGIYWLWKHVKDDYIGIVHYRRYFSRHYNGRLLSKSDIEKQLKKHDMILPFIRHLDKTVIEQYCESGYKKDLLITGEVIKEKYPEYYDEFEKFINGKDVYFGNMFITSKTIYDDMCRWLFDILFEVERRVDVSEYSEYFSRIYGFISERLLYVYVSHNKLDIFETGVVNTEEKWSFKKRFLTGIKRVINYYLKG